MKRRLAAILVADVIGFSRMMQADEAGTLTRLRQRRKDVLDPVVQAGNGRIVKLMGDGVLIEFGSALDAVGTALALQDKFAVANEDLPQDQRIVLRIGVNLGDVISQGSDVYGDSVNIAARLEALAAPGALCVSGKVEAEIRGKIDVDCEDLGEVEVKNISGGVRAFMLRPAGTKPHTIPAPAANGSTSAYPKLPRRPSIAVLPFQNMSADPEQEYFADGMVEDIITELSRNKFLLVIARNSSFAYKGRAVNVTQIGKELGVRYVLEGSVRRAGQRIRINGQLIEAQTGAHLWAERFDGDLTDVFDLQDQITERVVGEIAPRLERAEIERVRDKPTDSLDAYDHYLRGLAAFNQFNRNANATALEHFKQAIALDPRFTIAWAMASRTLGQRLGFGWLTDPKAEKTEALRYALYAEEFGQDDSASLAHAGFAIAIFGDSTRAEAMLDRASKLNPNLHPAFQALAMVKILLGKLNEARTAAQTAFRLSPQDSLLFGSLSMIAFAEYFEGDYEAARVYATQALQIRPNFKTAVAVMAASCAMLEDTDAAARHISLLREISPDLTLTNLNEWLPMHTKRYRDLWHEGLSRAGLPA